MSDATETAEQVCARARRRAEAFGALLRQLREIEVGPFPLPPPPTTESAP